MMIDSYRARSPKDHILIYWQGHLATLDRWFFFRIENVIGVCGIKEVWGESMVLKGCKCH